MTYLTLKMMQITIFPPSRNGSHIEKSNGNGCRIILEKKSKFTNFNEQLVKLYVKEHKIKLYNRFIYIQRGFEMILI